MDVVSRAHRGRGLRGLGLALLVPMFVIVSASCTRDPELRELAHVPEFAMRDQTGATRHAADFRGRPFVAAFVFTRCTSICPMLTSQMANFQRRLRGPAAQTEFVVFSVDPTHDTPEVLAAYARERGTTRHFTFLTGDFESLATVAREGFLAAVGMPSVDSRGTVDVIHSQHLLLVDRALTLRGFYRTDAEGLDALERDLDRLIDAPR